MKGKRILETVARAASDFKKNPAKHEAAEKPEHEAAEMEGAMEAGDELCPECHAKIMKHLSKRAEVPHGRS